MEATKSVGSPETGSDLPASAMAELTAAGARLITIHGVEGPSCIMVPIKYNKQGHLEVLGCTAETLRDRMITAFRKNLMQTFQVGAFERGKLPPGTPETLTCSTCESISGDQSRSVLAEDCGSTEPVSREKRYWLIPTSKCETSDSAGWTVRCETHAALPRTTIFGASKGTLWGRGWFSVTEDADKINRNNPVTPGWNSKELKDGSILVYKQVLPRHKLLSPTRTATYLDNGCGDHYEIKDLRESCLGYITSADGSTGSGDAQLSGSAIMEHLQKGQGVGIVFETITQQDEDGSISSATMNLYGHRLVLYRKEPQSESL